jgi:2-phosphosulfolactate phosphatase
VVGRHSRIRLGWGLADAQESSRQLATAAVFVVVDVLSFSTAVSVACDEGMQVFPYPSEDGATAFAEQARATLAGARGQAGASLSPASLRGLTGVARLVLPSPNGATICHALQFTGAAVLAGCLRNARAVGRWIAERLRADPEVVLVVIAAGERWSDGTPRPGIEDFWGAGAVIAAVLDELTLPASPAALAAAAGFHRIAQSAYERLAGSVSGRELTGRGFEQDVRIAAELDSTAVVPRLLQGRFVGC